MSEISKTRAVTSRYSVAFHAWPVCFTLSPLYPVHFGGAVKQTQGKADYVLPAISLLYPLKADWVKQTALPLVCFTLSLL